MESFSQTSHRDSYFDTIKGILAIFVIAIHSYNYFNHSIIDISLRQVIGISVPAFIAISGYFSYGKKYTPMQIFNKICRIYIPCIILNIPLLIKDGLSARHIIYLLMGGYGISYYVILLCQFYVIHNFLPINKTSCIITSAITIIWSLIFTRINMQQGLHLMIYVGLFPSAIGYYCIGPYCKEHSITVSQILPFYVLLLCVLESIYLNSKGYSAFGMKTSIVLLAIVAIPYLLTKGIK